ncbi:MAG: response regulator [Theionarchaea archaeon]|nr:response regulator [Theionarchaea archaeon]MBU7036739.1 response regulator [Theionarchaea archaeon]
MVRILWIEDEGNTDLIQYKQPLVEKGHVIDVAETAKEAFDTMDCMKYDLYIVDLLLPQEDAFEEHIELPGVEILKKMIHHYRIDASKIVVFTVVNDEEVHRDIRQLGIGRIIVKRLQDIDFLKVEIDKMIGGEG